MHQPNGTGALLLQQDREDQGKLTWYWHADTGEFFLVPGG
jgi:hypothetical protein